jgi:hypothetical protein
MNRTSARRGVRLRRFALIASPVFERAMIVLQGDRGSLILAGSQVNADESELRRSCLGER